MLKRNRQRGFTLIELLIVVAIIGIIAAILIPNLLDALQKAKQKRTVSDIRNTGTAWMSWLTDQVGATSAGAAKEYDATDLKALSYTKLVSYLRPTDTFFYMQEVPQLDGWRNPMQFGLNDDILVSRVMGIFAPCRQGNLTYKPTTASIPVLAFLSTDYDQDIVWADGYFVRYPEGTKR